MQLPPQLSYANSWKQPLCCSVLLGPRQSRAQQLPPADGPCSMGRARKNTITSTHIHGLLGKSRDKAIAKDRWNVYFVLCSLWGTEGNRLHLKSQPIKLTKQKPWLAVLMQRVQRMLAGMCLAVLLSIFSRAVLSVFMELHESRSVHLYIGLCIKAGRGESNYLSSLGRSNRQDLLVLILKY